MQGLDGQEGLGMKAACCRMRDMAKNETWPCAAPLTSPVWQPQPRLEERELVLSASANQELLPPLSQCSRGFAATRDISTTLTSVLLETSQHCLAGCS